MCKISIYDIDYYEIDKCLKKDALKGIVKDVFSEIVEGIEPAS